MNPTTRSQALLHRARKVVPNGVYGYSITPEAPVFFERGEGAHFTDIDGNTYIEWPRDTAPTTGSPASRECSTSRIAAKGAASGISSGSRSA